MKLKFKFHGRNLIVDGTYKAGTPDVRFLSNGDPGYPGDPPEFDIISVEADDGDPVTGLDCDNDEFYYRVINEAENTLHAETEKMRNDFLADQAYFRSQE